MGLIDSALLGRPLGSRRVASDTPLGLHGDIEPPTGEVLTYEPVDYGVAASYNPDFDDTRTFEFELWTDKEGQLTNVRGEEVTMAPGDQWVHTFEDAMIQRGGSRSVLLVETTTFDGGLVLDSIDVSVTDKTVDPWELSLSALRAMDLDGDGTIDHSDIVDLIGRINEGNAPTNLPDLNGDGGINQGESVFIFTHTDALNARYKSLQAGQPEPSPVPRTLPTRTLGVAAAGAAVGTAALLLGDGQMDRPMARLG